MTSIPSISLTSSNRTTLPFYVLPPLNRIAQPIFMKRILVPRLYTKKHAYTSSRVVSMAGVTEKSPPEIPTAPPAHDPAVPTEMPQMPNTPDFDPIPPEQPSDPPPVSPGPNPGPEFPGPPSPKPEIPIPPGKPEVIPPHGPEVIPPYTPEPGIPTPTMIGSDGLVFY